MRASGGRRKVAIVSDADRLQPQAANAFLKTLEEPPNDSLLLLLSALPEALPDTIRSRCIPIPLAPTAPEDAFRGRDGVGRVARRGGGAESGRRAEFVSARAGFSSSPGASEGSDSSGERGRAQTRRATLQEHNRWRLARRARGSFQGAEREPVCAAARAVLVEVLLRWWSDVLRARHSLPRQEFPSAAAQTRALAEKLSTPEILRRIRRVEELRDHLGRNIQEALALEVAFLNVFCF